jgi:hypothetical protein
MKSSANPIRSTIIWGLIGGLLYIPLCVALSRGEFSGVTLGIAGRIRGLAVTLGP